MWEMHPAHVYTGHNPSNLHSRDGYRDSGDVVYVGVCNVSFSRP